jgi:hypothetical protein
MRKLLVLPMAALLLAAIAAPVSAGANVTNSSQSAVTAQGYWGSGKEDGVETYGSLYAWQDSGSSSAYVEFSEGIGQYVDCTPADDTDDFYGFQGQSRYGSGDGTLNVGKGSSDAHASAILEIYTSVIDECAGTYDETSVSGVPVSLDLVANGPKIMERGTGSFKIPSQFNGHSSYTTTSRSAAGTAMVGDGPAIAVDGGIGTVSWRDHSNGG